MPKPSDAEQFAAAIDAMPDVEREIIDELDRLVGIHAPQLAKRLWYSMPGYALDGQVVFFFQSAAKFKTRYCTLGFNPVAKLDNGQLWPVAFAITQITPEITDELAQLISKSVGR